MKIDHLNTGIILMCPKCKTRVATKEKLTAVATTSRHGHEQGFTWETCCARCGHMFSGCDVQEKLVGIAEIDSDDNMVCIYGATGKEGVKVITTE